MAPKLAALTLLVLLGSSPASVEESAAQSLADAVTLLSRWPAGRVPPNEASLRAIEHLGAHGNRNEISLLRNLAERERSEIRSAAIRAISEVRGRQRDLQRLAFVAELPNWADLEAHYGEHRKRGQGPETAWCAAYARSVFGTEIPTHPPATDGDPSEFLAIGRPRRALAALRSLGEATDGRSLLEAAAREDMGDTRAAVRVFVSVAARTNSGAERVATYGVDLEMALLGVLSAPEVGMNIPESTLREWLVANGTWRTVEVLAERILHGSPSQRAEGARALRAMTERPSPLSSYARHTARRALARYAREDGETVLSPEPEPVE